MNDRKLLLVGGGGHCKSVLSAVLNAGRKVAGIIDLKEKAHHDVFGIQVIGDDDYLATLSPAEYEVIITVGSTRDNGHRAELFSMVKSIGFTAVTFMADSAVIGRDATPGEGTVVLEGAVLNTGVTTGCNCIINTGAIVEHDCYLGDHVHVCPGAVLSGGVKVGELSFIGAGAVILQGIEVGHRAVIGAGSVVLRDVPDGFTVAGNPAVSCQKRAGRND